MIFLSNALKDFLKKKSVVFLKKSPSKITEEFHKRIAGGIPKILKNCPINCKKIAEEIAEKFSKKVTPDIQKHF